jgi:hypothetical protein
MGNLKIWNKMGCMDWHCPFGNLGMRRHEENKTSVMRSGIDV